MTHPKNCMCHDCLPGSDHPPLPVKTGPSINKGKSRQDYATPWEFIHAVTNRFGGLTWDLAADEDNKKANQFITQENNSMERDWCLLGGNLWLNPPFGVIGPWARKCQEQSLAGAKVLMLTPASVGSNWFADYVHGRALVLFLSPRIQFEGADDPYPKDLMLSVFGIKPPGYECWRWK